MISGTGKRNINIMLILLYICVYLSVNLQWIMRYTPTMNKMCSSDISMRSKDLGIHIPLIYKSYKILKNKDLNIAKKFSSILHISSTYPPLLYAIFGVFSLIIGGVSYLAIEMLALILLGIFLFMVYKIGVLLSNSFGGVVSLILFSLFPITYIFTLHTHIFLLQSLLVITFIYHLIKAGHFENRLNSFLAGIFCGLAILAKQDAVIYILPVMCCVLLKSWNNCKLGRKRMYGNVFLMIATILVLIVPHYSEYLTDAYRQNSMSMWERMNLREFILVPGLNWYSPSILFFYFNVLFKSLSPAYTIVIIVAICLMSCWKSSYKGAMVAAIVFPLIVLTIMPLKYPHYVIPFIPAIALLTGSIISSLSNRLFKGSVFFIILFFGLFNMYCILLPKEYFSHDPMFICKEVKNFLPRPLEYFNTKDVVQVLNKNFVKGNVLVLFTDESHAFCFALKLYAIFYENEKYKFYAFNEISLQKFTAIVYYNRDAEIKFLSREEGNNLVKRIIFWNPKRQKSHILLNYDEILKNFEFEKSVKVSNSNYAHIYIRKEKF